MKPISPQMKAISIAEPITDLRRIPIKECGEPLVNFLEWCPRVLQDRPRFKYRRETLVRQGVAERLRKASEALPNNYRFSMIEGWRPPLIQRRMYQAVWNRMAELHPDWSHARLVRNVNRWTAPVTGPVPAPHTTGAAIDVILVTESGEPCDLSSPFDPNDSACFVTAKQGLSEEAAHNRRLLRDTLEQAGLTNYPSEYWHYSYGDQGWAYRGGHPHAIYNVITPDGWQPDPRDATDEPLSFVVEPPKL
jgi:D-alanyl-D-alanine dipeptidase